MIGPKTKGIMVPNLCGNCPDWDRIRQIAASMACPLSRTPATSSTRGYEVRARGSGPTSS